VCGLVAPEKCECVGRSPGKIDHFCFFLYKLTMQSIEEFFLLHKHCKDGGQLS
jgi:hypothetical protein